MGIYKVPAREVSTGITLHQAGALIHALAMLDANVAHLARHERQITGNTLIADRATHRLNDIIAILNPMMKEVGA